MAGLGASISTGMMAQPADYEPSTLRQRALNAIWVLREAESLRADAALMAEVRVLIREERDRLMQLADSLAVLDASHNKTG